MSAQALGQTGSHTVSRRAVTGVPGGHELVDGGFLLALIGLALWGFRTTFDSPRFMVAALLGALIGIAVAHVATTLRQHWLVVVLLSIVAFFLFGGAIAMSGKTIVGFIPTLGSVTSLAVLTVSGWKDLLTTLPPVDGSGQFVVLPYLLGLADGALGFRLARQTSRPAAPVAAPLVLLTAVILLGAMEPASLLVQGLGFTSLGFVWVAVRRRRLLRVVGTGAPLRSQGVVAAVLITASMGAAAGLGAHMPGVDAQQRTVLRSFIAPPFDVTRYPSPLVGFRKYTQGAKLVWDQTLLTVNGAQPGERLRIAVLDDYSGTVWSAGNVSTATPATAFRKVGSTISAPTVPASGEPQTLHITVGAAYAGLVDANVWVPGAGYAADFHFAGPGSAALADSLRYNTDTGQAVVQSRLSAGDVITSTQVPVSDVPAGFQSFGTSTLDPSEYDFVSAKATTWAAKKPTAWEQLQAVAATMQSSGAYSDGTTPGETQYLPGHGVSRLTDFLNRTQPVGDDEQYAATFALTANDLGVPARVVFGAVVPASGQVKGQDVHAWVEVRGSTGDWYAVPYTTFMPSRDKRPTQQPEPPQPDSQAANVPPPNAARPPGSADTTLNTDLTRRITPKGLFGFVSIPAWVVTVLTYVGVPAAILTGILLALALLRSARRRRRRHRGPGHRRLAQGWRDYVDHARDLGYAVPAGLTRREQSVIVGRPELAGHADQAVFGAHDPDGEAIGAYWSSIATARRELSTSATRWRRWMGRYSVRGLLTRDPRPVETSLAHPEQRARGLRLRNPLGGRA